MSIERLAAALERCTLPGGPALYRGLFGLKPGDGPLKISTWEEWRALPHLTKERLTQAPIADRAFVPVREWSSFTSSSGTSGKEVFFSGRAEPDRMWDASFRMEHFKEPTCIFASTNAYPHREHGAYEPFGLDVRVIAGEPANMSASILLAKAAGVDTAVVHVFAIPEFCKEMGNDAEASARVRVIDVVGQECPRSHMDLLQETFPNAAILPTYGASDSGANPLAIPCKPYAKGDAYDVYHVAPSAHFDLIDPETGEAVDPIVGADAEVLITDAAVPTLAAPLIRYRIGDMVRTLPTTCPHNSWSFTCVGRAELDVVKIPHGMLRASAVASTLLEFSEEVTDDFEMHCYEGSPSSGKRLRVELHVSAKRDTSLSRLAALIASRLPVSPTLTYGEGVTQGLYEPLRCLPLQETSRTKKIRRIVMHRAN